METQNGWRAVRRARRVRSHGSKRVGRFWKGEQQKCQMQKSRPERLRAGTCPLDSALSS